MRVIDGIAVFGEPDENTLDQMRMVSKYAKHSALSADAHFGYGFPVGGIAAYENQVSLNGVGFDISCGNCAVKTNLKLSDISSGKLLSTSHSDLIRTDAQLLVLADEIASSISFGLGGSAKGDATIKNHALFDTDAWHLIPSKFREELRDKARTQLTSCGSGNHYVDVFVDRTDDSVWVGVHFGSRGLGHTIASNFFALAQNLEWGERAKEADILLNLDTQLGQDYWSLMSLASEYAYAGRDWVVRKVASMFDGMVMEYVHNNHNLAWKETHFDGFDGGTKEYIVVRKGATPARPLQKGFVGGSMGDDAVILQGAPGIQPGDEWVVEENFMNAADGNKHYEQASSLYSTVHGAGRVMSRTAAAGKRNRKTGKKKTEGLISRDMMHNWIKDRGVIVRGGAEDEAPQAYRRLPDVLAAQGETIEILNVLRPAIVVMAGADVYDPYKE